MAHTFSRTMSKSGARVRGRTGPFDLHCIQVTGFHSKLPFYPVNTFPPLICIHVVLCILIAVKFLLRLSMKLSYIILLRMAANASAGNGVCVLAQNVPVYET